MVRVALAQFSGQESKEINIQKAEDLARQAAGNGARIICFPERIDPKVCDDVRELWGFFKFRRPDAYDEILKGTI